jgi:hypothetical protein
MVMPNEERNLEAECAELKREFGSCGTCYSEFGGCPIAQDVEEEIYGGM